MLAPAGGQGHLGRASELGRDDHEGLVELAARFQVGYQGGERLIEGGNQVVP